MNRPNGITITPMPPTMLTDTADKLRGIIESFKVLGCWHRDDQEFVHALSRLEMKLRGEAAARREDLG